MEGSASSEMKEETFKAQPSEKMMVVHLDELAPYQGTAGMTDLKEGAAGAVGE
jgi:hypothetical protein